MRKINLKSIICLLAIAFLYNTSKAQSSSISVSGSSSVCTPSTVTLNAAFGFTTPSAGTYRVVTEFWRYDVVAMGFCYPIGNDALVVSVTSSSQYISSATTVYNTNFYSGNPVVQAVNVSGFYRAKSTLQKQNGTNWDNVSSAWSPWSTMTGTPDVCVLNAPKVEVIEPNHTAIKFGINDVFVEAPIYGTPQTINIGSCYNIMMTDIGGNGDNAIVIVQKGTWGPDPGNPLLYKINSATIDTISISRDINTGFLDQNLTNSFPTGFFENNKDYNIILKMDKNSCDLTSGQESFSRVYHINRPSSPTISNVKLNNTAVANVCPVASAQTYYACNPITLTFDHSIFDNATITATTLTSCVASGSDYVQQYTSGGVDLRELLPKSNSSNITTVITGTYKIKIQSTLCAQPTETEFILKVDNIPATADLHYNMNNPNGTLNVDASGNENLTPSQVLPGNYVGTQSVSFSANVDQNVRMTYYRVRIQEVPNCEETSEENLIMVYDGVNRAATSLNSLGLNSNLPNTITWQGVSYPNRWQSPYAPSYFINSGTSILGHCFKLTLWVGNACGESDAKWSYFTFGGDWDDETGEWIPNGDASYKTDETKIKEIKVYPNPTNGRLYVLTPSNNQYNFSLSTIDGKQVSFNQKNDGNRAELELGSLSKGVYFLKIQSNTETEIRKITIE